MPQIVLAAKRGSRAQKRGDWLVFTGTTWQNKTVERSTKKDQPTTAAEDDDFCLADGVAEAGGGEIERTNGQDAAPDVSSSASSGIPPDETALEGGLTAIYLRARGERAAQDSKLPFNCDVPMLIEEIEDRYRHLWGSYLALARHFEKHGPPEEATRYNEKFHHFCQFEMNLYLLSVEEWWRHKTEVLPPLLKEMRSVRQQILGY